MLAAGALLPLATSVSAQSVWRMKTITLDEKILAIQAGGPSGLLATSANGNVFAVSASGKENLKIASGIDAASPLAATDSVVAGRTKNGSLWAWSKGKSEKTADATIAPHAGLLILPTALIAVVSRGASQYLARFEFDSSNMWREVARSSEAVLPDARPVLATLDGQLDGGQVVVLGGPDASRYRHGVIGDDIEATSVLSLDTQSLKAIRSLQIPAPYVFEDIAPRVVRIGNRSVLLTIRSGPRGSQLALIASDANRADGLQLLALGDDLGTSHRWMSPTTDGMRIMAVHTPHIGGVLFEYRLGGDHLVQKKITGNVATHRIETRELDMSVWIGDSLVVPSQDGRTLRVLKSGAEWTEGTSIDLPTRVIMTRKLSDGHSFAVLTEDGVVHFVNAE